MVAPLIIGGAIAAGSSILGGMMNKSSAYDQWKRDADLQREFAQNSLQWRMQDAKKAGIHPTVAAGASPGQAPIVSSPTPDNGLSQAGQAISSTLIQKKQADLIDAQIANINAQTKQLNEPLEINGQETSINNIQPQATKNAFPLEELSKVGRWKDLQSNLNNREIDLPSSVYRVPLNVKEIAVLKEVLPGEAGELAIDAINGGYIAKEAFWKKVGKLRNQYVNDRRRFVKSLKSYLFHLDRRNRNLRYKEY